MSQIWVKSEANEVAIRAAIMAINMTPDLTRGLTDDERLQIIRLLNSYAIY